MTPKEARANAARDQAWAALREKHSDIDRIIRDGPSSERDMLIVKQCMLVVAGDLAMNAAQG